jgi:hypothetical protein
MLLRHALCADTAGGAAASHVPRVRVLALPAGSSVVAVGPGLGVLRIGDTDIDPAKFGASRWVLISGCRLQVAG